MEPPVIPEQTHRHVLGAARRALRSLARLLIRFGVRFDEFSAIARVVYVESAIRDHAHPNTPSRARISALTGLTARQVDYCIDHEDEVPTVDPTLRGLLVEVLHKWHTVPEYGGPYGIPLELEFSNPPQRCFSSLVSLVSSEVNPNLLLGELLRSGAILRAGESRFRPVSRFLMMPDPNSPRLIERFGMTVSRLAATLEYNMDPKQTDKRLERRVSADRGLPLQLVSSFEAYARSKAADFLLELDNWLAAQVEAEGDAADTSEWVDSGVNIFLYIDPIVKDAESFSRAANSRAPLSPANGLKGGADRG